MELGISEKATFLFGAVTKSELKHAANTSPYDYCVNQNFMRSSQDVLNECVHFMSTTFEIFLLAICVFVIKQTLKSTFSLLITNLPFHNTNSTTLATSRRLINEKNAQKKIKVATPPLHSSTNSL